MIRRLLFATFLLTPFFLASLWTAAPALRALYAAKNLQVSPSEITSGTQNPQKALELRRKVQKAFLDQNVYIPFEDIFFFEQLALAERDTFVNYVRQNCSRGEFFVWIPIKFRLPIIGDRIIEWCFVPPLLPSKVEPYL